VYLVDLLMFFKVGYRKFDAASCFVRDEPAQFRFQARTVSMRLWACIRARRIVRRHRFRGSTEGEYSSFTKCWMIRAM